MPNRKTSLRIAIAILLLWLLIPYIFGAGWALANFAYLGFYGSQHPETTEALRSMERAEKESYAKSLVEKTRKPSVVVLSLAGFAFMGALYGLIVRHWQSAFLIFLLSLWRGNPAFFAVPLSPFERVLIVLLCQLLVSYSFAYLFSRIGIKPAEPK